MAVSVEADFLTDLRSILSQKLTAGGYSVDPAATVESLLWDHLKVQHRRVERRVRGVFRSAELQAREATLPENQRAALDRIQAAVENGDDLNPYLSRQLANDQAFKKNDLMLNDLGMHHMHLGEGLNAEGMINGTKELLFVLITEDAVYFVEILDHDSFADDAPFLIAQASWPSLFRPSGIPQSRAAVSPPSKQQRQALRRKGGNALLVARDGTTYLPPGGGVAGTGISPKVVSTADMVLDRISFLEGWCNQNGADLADRVAAEGHERPSFLRLRFEGFEESGAARIIDEVARVLFRISDPAQGT